MDELSERIKKVLLELRVVLPGTQALLGFQFIIIWMDPFDGLPRSSKLVHLCALGVTAFSAIMLMAPAAHHRLAEKGEDSEELHAFASRCLLRAMAALALAICLDFFVVAREILSSTPRAAAFASALLALFSGLWFGVPRLARDA